MNQVCVVFVFMFALANAGYVPAQVYNGLNSYANGARLNHINGCAVKYIVDSHTSYVSLPGTNSFEPYFTSTTFPKFNGQTIDSQPICAIDQQGRLSFVGIRFGLFFGVLVKIGISGESIEGKLEAIEDFVEG